MDYKVSTEILMERLCTRLARVLSPEIGTHQSAFLIDDNICTVQFVIARSKIRLGVLFLDLEKAYDRSATISCGR